MMQSRNTMLNSQSLRRSLSEYAGTQRMSIDGTVAKTGLLVGITTAAAVASYTVAPTSMAMYMGLTLGGGLLAFIGLLVAGFKPNISAWTALPVSLGLGGMAGGSSFAITSYLPAPKEGAALQSPEAAIFSALLLTICIAGGLLGAYATGLLRPGRLFRSIMGVAAIGITLFSFVSLGMWAFGNDSIVSLFSTGSTSIFALGLTGVITLFVAGMLVLDFQMVHQYARSGAPKYMEWYGAQSILYSLVYLYVYLLRLIVMLTNRE